MCLIVFAWQQHADYPLILAANRDEFHARPAEPMGWWHDTSTILGGRDLEAGGSWLAVAKNGRFAAVTNYREGDKQSGLRSRGDIVTQFVAGSDAPQVYADTLPGDDYSGFNALFGDAAGLYYASNRAAGGQLLQPGMFGLSNALLDTPWDKLVRSKSALDHTIRSQSLTLDALLDVVDDRDPAAVADESSGDLPAALARAASAPFIVTPEYGTRCSTAMLCRADGHIEIAERRFDADGTLSGESRFVFVSA
jgi:uncharacterized protein with NRDE domain